MSALGRNESKIVGWTWPTLLALIALALNAYFYSGFYMSDDISYLEGIQRLAAMEKLDAANIAHTRLALTVPAALIYFISGSVGITIASFCLYHPAVVVLTYVAGHWAFGRAAAITSAGMVALCPIYYFFGGAILPDNCLSMWLGLLLLLVLVIVDRGYRGELSRRRELWLWAGAGVLTGVAYYAKEPGIVMSVPIVGTIVLTSMRRLGWRWAAAAVASYGLAVAFMLLLEILLLRVTSGEWTIRLLSGVGNAENVEALLKRVQQQGLWPTTRLVFLYKRLAPYFLPLGLWLMIATNVAAVVWFRGAERRAALIAIAFCVWPLLYLTVGTTNFTRYLPPPIQHPRYYSICLMPALLVTGAVTVRLSRLVFQRILAGRLAWGGHWVPALMVVLWGVVPFLHFEPEAGTAYRAPQTKSALAAFKDARKLYPKRPLVLSRYLSARLQPLIQARECTKCPQLVTEVRSLEEVPERPFLVMTASKAYDDSLGPTLENLRKTKALRFRRAGLGPYRAPRGRRSEILAGLYPLFSELIEPHWPLTIERHAIDLFVVTDPKPAEPPK
jgi:hypothetical protein